MLTITVSSPEEIIFLATSSLRAIAFVSIVMEALGKYFLSKCITSIKRGYSSGSPSPTGAM